MEPLHTDLDRRIQNLIERLRGMIARFIGGAHPASPPPLGQGRGAGMPTAGTERSASCPPGALVNVGGDDWIDVDDACKGIALAGASGSGKTSTGMGRFSTRAVIARGFGGIVIPGKPEDFERFAHLMETLGRRDGPGGDPPGQTASPSTCSATCARWPGARWRSF